MDLKIHYVRWLIHTSVFNEKPPLNVGILNRNSQSLFKSPAEEEEIFAIQEPKKKKNPLHGVVLTNVAENFRRFRKPVVEAQHTHKKQNVIRALRR